MSKVNLAFQKHYYLTHEFDLQGEMDDIKRINYTLPEDYKGFFRRKGHCPFCKESMNHVYQNSKSATIGVDLYQAIDIWECDCGYWDAFSQFIEEKDLIYSVDSKHWEKRICSVVSSLEDVRKEKAIKQLINVIQKDSSKAYSVKPKHFEEIAQFVFSAYFNCEVEHVGKSHDGGIDLLIVNSDKPILVQVKRRTKSDAVESISTIRDFLGAMYIKSNFNGIIVSTAKRFSKPSNKVIADLKSHNKLEYFELFDFNRFLSILNAVNLSRKKCWEFLVSDYNS
ncbi:MAG: restriction endonuclease [Ignavibacteriales bacterium]|nr:restriction endonuclease [Ignavibacteriales bacterium]